MDPDNHTTYLLGVIIILGTICFGRWVYLEMPDTPVIDNYSEEAGAKPLQ
jgi:hypothetical protein